MHRATLLAGLFASGVCIARMATAADGDPDLTFGNNGQLTIERPDDFPNTSTPPGDASALPDGRFLWVMAHNDGSIWVGRAAHDGSADATFGSDGSGRVTLTECTAFSTTRLIADADGSAVVWSGACLLRLAGDGSSDAGFGIGPLPEPFFWAGALARDHAGRYVLAGTAGQEWRVFRFNADGTLDATFGDDGEATVAVPATNSLRELYALAIRDDDRIVLAGARGNTHGPNLVVAQLLQDGTPDTAWNGTGLVDMEPPPDQSGLIATALAIDGDGSVIVAGNSNSGGTDCCLLLARLDTNGQLVDGFGLRLFGLGGNTSLSVFFESRDTLALLPNGQILLATTAFPFPDPPQAHRTQFVLVRANSDGLLDASFANGGWRGYTIDDPSGTGQSGDYDQGHAMVYAGGSALVFGRTFFEDSSIGYDYVSMIRANFDAVFADGFD